MNIKKDVPLPLQAYNLLKKRIIGLQLRPKEILMIQTLAKELGISRTPVREAVVRLEREGLVEAAEGKKFKVSALTMQGVLEIHEIRKLMEIHAVRNVAKFSTKKQIAGLNATISSMKKSLVTKSHDNFCKFDLAFHEKIILLNGNKTLEHMMNQINDKIQRIRYLTTYYIENRLGEEAVREHRDVLTAIEAHDPDRAEQKMAFHLDKVGDGFAIIFEKQVPQFIGGMFMK